ncbi:heavy metal-associated isoprenylated plant 47-like [Olea europaea subsp. europaea]|uniref:Heavy metal-associated isoprenylated plant 47-like n=1 Tax=Olea europaea subsp. europaea TaxID=158383 RepID=A0A8S0VA46_OLEEU|nr:heavy metal-associated isoprenylated plant 47-like [Olea europaea subsp. europaea]
MKQKAEFQVEMRCSKCQKKALQIAAETYGVSSLTLGGQNKNQLVVTGEGMDITKLCVRLRNKIGYTQIVSVSEVK